MVDDSVNIVNNLKTILTTYYDNVVNSNYVIPCITYINSNNTAKTNAKAKASIRYFDVGYDVKLWVNSKADINTYSTQIENKMASLGYTLTGGREMQYGNLICLNMVFSGVGYEK